MTNLANSSENLNSNKVAFASIQAFRYSDFELFSPVNLPEELQTRKSQSNSEEESWSSIVFPNPVGQILNINVNITNEKSMQLELFSLAGKLIATKLLSTGMNSMDFVEISNGLYFYRITDNEGKIYNSGKISHILR